MERALALQEQLAAEHPDDVGYLEVLGTTLDTAGITLRNARRPAESLPYRQRAWRSTGGWRPFTPRTPAIDILVARNHLFIGVSLIDLGRTAEALKELEPAAAILERVVAEHPGMTRYREDLAYAQINLATSPQSPGTPGRRAVRAGAGPPSTSASPPTSSPCYNLACTDAPPSGLAIGSEREAHAVRAMATLRRAIAAGYRDLNSLRKDSGPRPAPIAPDFQVLLLDVAFPADPFAR